MLPNNSHATMHHLNNNSQEQRQPAQAMSVSELDSSAWPTITDSDKSDGERHTPQSSMLAAPDMPTGLRSGDASVLSLQLSPEESDALCAAYDAVAERDVDSLRRAIAAFSLGEIDRADRRKTLLQAAAADGQVRDLMLAVPL